MNFRFFIYWKASDHPHIKFCIFFLLVNQDENANVYWTTDINLNSYKIPELEIYFGDFFFCSNNLFYAVVICKFLLTTDLKHLLLQEITRLFILSKIWPQQSKRLTNEFTITFSEN